ncbi:hypothetical protein L3Q82_026093%2C partial [Xyrichtys novacula]|uniref:Niban 1/2/3 domain-containing protein n=1 Tax=Xyrichtys novacula TaxID=13765 RepID=A0AAV1FEZ0_XYRNO|nr:hypothetical protein L3Q82_026093%2C partial [Xyrichtys novacula]
MADAGCKAKATASSRTGLHSTPEVRHTEFHHTVHSGCKGEDQPETPFRSPAILKEGRIRAQLLPDGVQHLLRPQMGTRRRTGVRTRGLGAPLPVMPTARPGANRLGNLCEGAPLGTEQYDYDSSTVRKKISREALVSITLPFTKKSLASTCKAELKDLEQTIYPDHVNFVNVDNV